MQVYNNKCAWIFTMHAYTTPTVFPPTNTPQLARFLTHSGNPRKALRAAAAAAVDDRVRGAMAAGWPRRLCASFIIE
jgi:hypothetical protein